MAEYQDREHFIPLRKSDLIEVLCKDKQLSVQEREPFRQFCLLVSCVFHFEYLQQLEELKDAYAPFDPDADTKVLKPLLPEERQQSQDKLFEKFTALLERANFKHLTQQEIEATVAGASEWGIDVNVDFNVFERLEAFVRGDTVGVRRRRRWTNLWRLEESKVPLYQRLVLILKLKPHRSLDKDIDTNTVFLKIFKDIPKMDMDMLLPGAKVRMSRVDRALIVYPLATGVGLLLFKVILNITHDPRSAARAGILAALATGFGALASWSIAGAVGGYGYKSYHSYQVKKQDYSLRLTKSLYFQSLDNNQGVLMRLLDEAEEQECRETYLAYFCLLKYAPPQGWTAEQLDDYVEMYLEEKANLKVDFEIGDALAKLERLKIVQKIGNAYRAQPMDKALEMLDWTWDNYFKYNNPEPEVPPIR
jgi:hypothetical protein